MELLNDYEQEWILKNEEFDGVFDHGKKMGNGYHKFENGDLFYGFFENDII